MTATCASLLKTDFVEKVEGYERRQGTVVHSCLTSLSHCGLIRGLKEWNLRAWADLYLLLIKKIQIGSDSSNLPPTRTPHPTPKKKPSYARKKLPPERRKTRLKFKHFVLKVSVDPYIVSLCFELSQPLGIISLYQIQGWIRLCRFDVAVFSDTIKARPFKLCMIIILFGVYIVIVGLMTLMTFYSLFRSVIPEVVFDFLREIGVFYKIWSVLR